MVDIRFYSLIARQEYEAHLDFEETGLFALYSACRQAGLKCC